MTTSHIKIISCDVKDCEETVVVHDWDKAKKKSVLNTWGRAPTRSAIIRDLCPVHNKEYKKGLRVVMKKKSSAKTFRYPGLNGSDQVSSSS